MQDEIDLRLTQEELFLLLTGARLFDKLVAGVTIHAEERDELIREVIQKMSEKLNAQMDSMSNELAEAIVESVLGCGELDSELDDLELACLDSDMEEIILKEFFQEHQSRQLHIEGLSYNSKTPGDGSIDEIDYIQEYPSAKCNNFAEKLDFHQRSSRQRDESQRFSRLEQFMNDDIFTYPMYSVQDKLPVLEKALLKHRAVKANYYSIARETVDAIRLNPLVLLQEDGMWLVVAYCHEKDDIFVFRVDRMKDVFETNHTFETPQNINELRCKMLAAYK